MPVLSVRVDVLEIIRFRAAQHLEGGLQPYPRVPEFSSAAIDMLEWMECEHLGDCNAVRIFGAC